jgi:Cu-Zn family superoxide dismutase
MNFNKTKTKKKSLKNNNKKFLKAICVLHQNNNNIYGIIKFTQINNKVKIEYEINNLQDGYHGFHIHNYGDLTDGCKSACNHFNPYNKNHGSNNSKERHLGDLGNIKSLNKKAKGVIYNSSFSLNPKQINSIIGRAIIVHEDIDDLGKGNNNESLKTGNAGKRLACGVIGLSNFKC